MHGQWLSARLFIGRTTKGLSGGQAGTTPSAAPHLQLCNQSQPTSPHSLSLRLLMGEHKRTIIQSHQPAMAPEVLPQAYDHYKKLLLRVGSWQTSHRKDGKKEGLDRKDRKYSCCVSYFLTLSQP